VRSAAALLSEVPDGEDPGPSQPQGMGDTGHGALPPSSRSVRQHLDVDSDY
jgi:hypothetical protein